MLAHVRLRLADGSVTTLTPGDVVGRTSSAALRLDDPHVSEAHALLSLRGEALVLLALRRRLWVDGAALDSVVLTPGLVVRLAPQVELVVEEVRLPGFLLALEGAGLPTQGLTGTCSLVFVPEPRLVPGVVASAAAVFWPTDERWRVRLPGVADRALEVGDRLVVGGLELRAVAMGLDVAGQTPTRADLTGPLRIVAHFDTVHVHRGGDAPLVLTGQLARLVSELVAAGNPLPWQDVAGQLWPHLDDRDALRRRWDVLLVRLRDRLRAGSVRSGLVQSTRVGLVELVLHEGDRVEDHT